jgi:hypothetical protein
MIVRSGQRTPEMALEFVWKPQAERQPGWVQSGFLNEILLAFTSLSRLARRCGQWAFSHF